MILGIDPGPTLCGLSILGEDGYCWGAWCGSVGAALAMVSASLPQTVAIERVQAQRVAGSSLMQTAEAVGRLQQRAMDSGREVVLIYRREVLEALDVTGRGCRDVLVRQRLIEARPELERQLRGAPSHCWSALAVAWAVAHRAHATTR